MRAGLVPVTGGVPTVVVTRSVVALLTPVAVCMVRTLLIGSRQDQNAKTCEALCVKQHAD
jgi:hypothetical protein